MFTDESSYTKCFYYICIVNDLLYEKRKIKEMKVKKNLTIQFYTVIIPTFFLISLFSLFFSIPF